MELVIKPQFLAPNGYLHAASIIALADTAAGYATIAHLPDGATSFTTIELKSNFLGTAIDGTLRADAQRRASGSHDAGVGCDRDACRQRQDDRVVSLHADDSVAKEMKLDGKDYFRFGRLARYRAGDRRSAPRADGANVAIAAKTVEAESEVTRHDPQRRRGDRGGGRQGARARLRHSRRRAGHGGGRKTAENFGGIDILINNASAISLTPTEATPMKRFDSDVRASTCAVRSCARRRACRI